MSRFREAANKFEQIGATVDLWYALDAVGELTNISETDNEIFDANRTQDLLDKLTAELSPEDRATFLLDKTSVHERLLIDKIEKIPARLPVRLPVWSMFFEQKDCPLLDLLSTLDKTTVLNVK